MAKNQGRECHSELFAYDFYKKCISIGETPQEVQKLNLLVIKLNRKDINAEKYGKVMEWALDFSKALNLCLVQGQQLGNIL